MRSRVGHQFKSEVEEGDGEVWARTGDQSRQLMAVVVKDSGKANLEITLEWELGKKVNLPDRLEDLLQRCTVKLTLSSRMS